MCFFLRIDVVLQRDTPGARAAFDGPAAPAGTRLDGSFPRWHLTDGHCSCGIVDASGAALDKKVDPLLRALAADEKVKRVEVLWYWGDDPPPAPAEEKLGIDDFLARNEARELAQDTCYRVNDPAKWAR